MQRSSVGQQQGVEHDSVARALGLRNGDLLESNELAYEECKRLSALIPNVVDDECLEYYEAGDWLDDIDFARGDWANGRSPGSTCHE